MVLLSPYRHVVGPSKEDFGFNFAVGGLNLQFFGVLYKFFGIINV